MHISTNLPKPENLLATSGVMSIDCVSLPVHQVYLLHPAQHHLQTRRKQDLSNGTTMPQTSNFMKHQTPCFSKGCRDRNINTSNSLASKYWRYCWGRTSLKPSKNAWVCSSTPLESLHSATNLCTKIWGSNIITLKQSEDELLKLGKITCVWAECYLWTTWFNVLDIIVSPGYHPVSKCDEYKSEWTQKMSEKQFMCMMQQYLMYSSLFFSVTWTFPPSGFSSWVVTSPRISLSTEKNISRPHSSMLLSLQTRVVIVSDKTGRHSHSS